MSPTTAFRTAVMAEPALMLCAVLYSVLAAPSTSQDWQNILAWSGDSSLILSPEHESSPTGIAVIVATIAFLLIYFINQIALFCYWRHARRIYLLLTITGFGLTPLLGLTVALPLETLASNLAYTATGIILALAYFSPVAARFQRVRVSE